MKRATLVFVLGMIFLAAIASAQGAEKTAASKTPQNVFQVIVSKGALSLDVRDASLAKVFQEIGKQAGITVEGNVEPAETVTMRLDNVPLEEGIKRLSNNVTIHYGDKANDKGHRITKIVVLSEDKRKVAPAQGVKAATPAKLREPEPRPEPFKFEFDPGEAAK